MRVLVTGANGRVGRSVVAELLRMGHSVVGLDLGPAPAAKANLSYVQGALEDQAAVARATTDVDAVIHLGALMSWVEADAPRVFASNVTGTFNLMEAVARKGLKRFVFGSSGEVYPENRSVFLPLDEHHPTQPNTAYGMSKLLGEDMVWFYARKYGIPAVALRFEHTQDASELLDPDSFFSGPRFFLRGKIRQQRQFGNTRALAVLEPLDDGTEKLLLMRGEDGTPYRMLICDTRDLTQGIVLALTAPRAVGEAIGIGPNEAVSFEEALAWMHEATGLPVVEANLPGPAVNYYASNAKARELLGFRPQWDFRAMVAEAAAAWTKRQTGK